MKSVLFTLGLAFCCFLQAEGEEVTPNKAQCLGVWVSHAVACSSENHMEQLRGMSMFVTDLSEPRKDVFRISVLVPMPDGCRNVTHEFRKEENGIYCFNSGDTKVTVESVKVEESFVISTLSVKDSANEFITTILHSRQETQDPEMIQKFKDECKKKSYPDDQVVVLSPPVKCR
uniref:Lipocalin n=1 Tax=Rhabdophis tigrinus TaxID=126484 RepID=I0BWR2_9SAUR|nr:lipocalin [Rhabdophis tigrinus]